MECSIPASVFATLPGRKTTPTEKQGITAVDIEQITGQELTPDDDNITRLPVKSSVTLFELASIETQVDQNFGEFKAPFTGIAVLMILVAQTDILSLAVQTLAGPSSQVTGKMLADASTPGQIQGNSWYMIGVPISKGNTYAFQVHSLNTATIQVTGTP